MERPETYDDRRIAVHRSRRLPDEFRDAVRAPHLSPTASNLLLFLTDLPPRFQINVAHVVGLKRYGGRDKVRGLFAELRAAGYMTVDPQRRPDGTYERGIYLVSIEPRWLDAAPTRPVDISEGDEIAESVGIGLGKADQPGPAFQGVGIDNSICNPDTPTCASEQRAASCREHQADGRFDGRKAPLTEQAERRIGGAKAGLPRNEPRKGAAKGSAAKRLGSGGGDQMVGVRDIERLRTRLIHAAGPAIADPKTTPGLWRMAEIIIWLSMGYDLDRDIVPVITDISRRPAVEPGQVRSWRYFSAAIREHHARRTGEAPPRWTRPAGPRRADDAWQPVGLALAGGRR